MEVDFARLDRVFSPHCIAVIGDRGRFQWTRSQATFKGKLYSVQISPKSIQAIEAMGVKNYTSLLDIPEPVDLVIVSVSRAVAPQILEDCIRKGVAAVHFFTAGFSETDTEEGRALERQLFTRATEANLYLIGPNCLGVHNPRLGVRQNVMQYTDTTGPVSFISQSGAHAVAFSFEGHFQGVGINKSISFGNGVVLDSPDYLEYFGRDADTTIIGMYVEGVKDGRRFLSVLRKVAASKPVVIWKGGRTKEGDRAVASHTGSLAIGRAVWEAAVKQCGAISVTSLEELVDTVEALLYLPPVRGSRVGILGGSGGQSVSVSDAFAEEGLEAPMLTQKSYSELASFFNLVGGSYLNPIDPGAANRSEMKRLLGILERDDNIDNIVLMLTPPRVNGMRTIEENDDNINQMIDLKKRTSKPLMAVIPYHAYSAEDAEQSGNMVRKLVEGGIAAFYTVGRGARALKNALGYYRRRESLEGRV